MFPWQHHASRKQQSFNQKVIKGHCAAGTNGIMEVTVCYRLISHNNGNMWFTLFDSFFYFSITLNVQACPSPTQGMIACKYIRHNKNTAYEHTKTLLSSGRLGLLPLKLCTVNVMHSCKVGVGK